MGTPEIQRYATVFYKELFERQYVEDIELAGYFHNGLQVEADTNAVLDAELSLIELCTALMSLGIGKAPCIDGLPIINPFGQWLVSKKGDLKDLKNWICVGTLKLSF